MPNKKQLVIIGGGAGGLELATKMAQSKDFAVTLIDANITHIWKPLLHEVAAGSLNSDEAKINYFSHAYNNGYVFEYGRFSKLDRSKKTITLDPILDDKKQQILPVRELHYDVLVIAIGSVANDFNMPSVKQHCMFLESQKQAEDFHQKILNLWFKHYNLVQNQPSKLNIAIVGAGATGVELAAELRNMSDEMGMMMAHTKKALPKVGIHIIEASPRILSYLPESVSKKVEQRLQTLQIEIHTNERVTEITEEKLVTKNGLTIEANIKIWAAGIKAPKFLAQIGGLTTNDKDQIMVKPTLQSIDDENIFAIGDCASCPRGENSVVPPRAQAAHQQALLLVKSFKNLIKNKPLPAYKYNDYGSLVSLSDSAVGNLMGILKTEHLIEGRLAYWIYRALYRKHLNVVYGLWHTILLTVGDLLTGRVKPRLKLH